MTRFWNIARRHRSAILIAFVVGAIYVSQHAVMSYRAAEAGRMYYPAIVEGNFDEGYYALRAKAAYGGIFPVGDINLFEHEGSPAFLPILNPIIMAGLGHLTGSMKGAFIFSDFIFPAIIFVLMYALAFELSGRKGLALLFASLFLIMPKFGLFPSPGALPFLQDARELYFSRFEYPSVTFPFYAATLYLLLRTIKRQELASALLCGLTFGLVFYTYFFDWVFIVLVFGFLSSFFALHRDGTRIRLLLTAGAIAVLVSVFYWVNFLELRALPSYQDIVERVGVEVGRFFRLEVVWPTYVRHAVLVAVLAWLYRRKREFFAYGAGLLLPIYILLNIQVFTGYVPQPDHWHRTQFLPLALAYVMILCRLLPAFDILLSVRLRKALVTGSIVLIFGYALSAQSVVAWQKADLFFVNDESRAAYVWLRDHTEPRSVVMTLSGPANDEIMLFTKNKIYVANGLISTASTDEIWERAAAAARVFGLDREAFGRYVGDHTLYLFSDKYRNTEFNAYFKDIERVIPPEVLSERKAAYLLLPFPEYRFDYFLLSDRDRVYGATESALAIYGAPVYNNGRITIYKKHD